MELSHSLLLAWAALSFWELGQIWLVQIVTYPLFAKVDAADYAAYHQYYTKRIPLVVIVPGFAGFLLPIPLAFFGPSVPVWMMAANIIMGIIGLLVTVGLEIPRHNKLESGKNEGMIEELIRYNWPRTLSITAQAAVTTLMVLHVMAGR
jgi:hypothetical protein